jgi:ABC-type glycerol-3-phosphate transport system substrate-binding protein
MSEVEVLQSIINSFTRTFSDVTFMLRYIPKDELFQRYHDAAYLGGGPSILFGPSSWGLGLASEGLLVDLKPYASADILQAINPAVLASGYYHGKLISLPLSQIGQVIYRNTSLISSDPETFTQLIASAQAATHGGIVGSYFERGSFFSAADIMGLGGNMMDDNGYPVFNDQYGLEWLDLLAAYDDAGAITFNTNRDLDMFKRARVGMIIEGTWNMSSLVAALGSDHLTIDPWPTYGTGHLSGWVWADSVYVNSNVTDDNLLAALNFIGYLLDPNVQVRLAEVGHIPSVTTSLPRDPLIQQAMIAFARGTAYPNHVGDDILSTYWKELNKVVVDVFTNGVDASKALKQASDNISQTIRVILAVP